MVKAYLKYELDRSFGVIADVGCAAYVVRCRRKVREKLGVLRSSLAASPAVSDVVLWNLRSGGEVRRLTDEESRKAGTVTSMQVGPSGLRIAVGYSDGSVRLWSILSGEVETVFAGHVSRVLSLAFATKEKGMTEDDGLLISGSADGEIIVWDPSAERGRFRLHAAHSAAVTALVVVGGAYIVSGSKDGLVKVFEIETQSCVQTVVGHPGEVRCMDVWNDRLLVTASTDHEVRAWKVQTDRARKDAHVANGNGAGVVGEDEEEEDNQRIRNVDNVLFSLGSIQREGASRTVYLRFHPHGTLLAAHGSEKSVQLFHVRDEDDAKRHRTRRRKRIALKTNPNSFDMGEANGTSTKSKMSPDVEDQYSGSLSQLQAVDYFHHARSIAIDYKARSVDFLDSQRDTQLLVHMHHNLLEVLQISLDHGVKSKTPTNATSPSALRSIVRVDQNGHRGDTRAMALAADDNTLFTVSSSKTIKIWDTKQGRCVRTIGTCGYGLCCRLLHADSLILVGFKSGALEGFDVGSGERAVFLEDAHRGAFWGLDVLPEDRGVVSCSADHSVKLWRLEAKQRAGRKVVSMKLERSLELGDDVLSVVTTMDGKFLLASLLDATVRAFFVDSFKPYHSFYGHKLPVLSMSVSSDGAVLATGSADKSVKLWGMDFGDCRRSLRAHDGPVMTVNFQPDTHYLFTGSRDGKLKYWDADRFELITELPGQRGEVWSSVCSQDGEILISSSHDKSIRVWRRTDEMMFVEEERNKRFEGLLEQSLEEDERERRMQEPIVPEEVKAITSLAGRRTMDAVHGGEGLMEALELAEVEKMRIKEAPTQSANVELLGLSAELFVLRALKRIRRTELEPTLQLLPMRDAMRILEWCVLWLEDEAAACVDVELIHRTVVYLTKSFHDHLVISGDRAVLSQLADLLHTRLEQYRSNVGFNITAMELIQSEIRSGEGGMFAIPKQPTKRQRRSRK